MPLAPPAPRSRMEHAHSRHRVLGTRAAVAGLALSLLLSACSGSGEEPPPDPPDASESPASPQGSAQHMTVVAPEDLGGIGEYTDSRSQSGVDVELSYPEVPAAASLTDRIRERTERAVEDFILAIPDAAGITVDWELTAAAEDVLGIRLTTEEEGDEGTRTAYETLWYDAVTGHTADSTELVANYEALSVLAGLAADEARAEDNDADVDGDLILPVARLFNSIGFNPRGDLVVEFDEGKTADAEAGRVFAVIDGAAVEPLLSDLGQRARDAATGAISEFELSPPPEETPDSKEAPGVLPPRDDGVDCEASGTKCVALTFDDGPGPRTPELLDTLAEYDAKATFFITGAPTRLHSDTVRRIYAEGHELGNHTMTHPQLTRLSDSGVVNETAPLQAMIRRETGYTPHIVRPPYGATNDSVQELMAEGGMAEILWSVDTLDWKDRDSDKCANRAIRGARAGSIILFHDIHDTTIDAIPRILRELEEKGFTFVTTTQLLGETEPGETYESADDS